MTPEQGKLLLTVFTDTMKNESELTKKVIRAIPEDKKSYKPDAKSMTAHELAWHLATAECWFLDTILDGKVTMTDTPPPAPPTIAAVLDWYQTNYGEKFQKLEQLPAEKLTTVIPFFGVMEMPAVAYLNFMNLHTAHHRGQLSTYLRPMGSKVPSIYGGSADEPFKG
jgi:uncharacterized damage-inducible protein DinB